MKMTVALYVVVALTGIAAAQQKDEGRATNLLTKAVTALANCSFEGDVDGCARYVTGQAKKDGLSKDTMLAEMASMAREYRRQSEDTGKWSDEDHNDDAVRCLRVLQIVAVFRDRSTLPLFEEMAVASNWMIRMNGFIGYIKLAGTDSVPFLQKVLQNGRLTELDHYRIYRTFQEQLESAREHGDNKGVQNGVAFLLETAQRENKGNAAKRLDEALCSLLPDYSKSVQREEVAARFVKEGNDYYKRHFGTIKEEIEKTHEGKRKDFRAKGELLDHERKKNEDSTH